MVAECCVKGYYHSGTPVGAECEIAGRKCYSTGNSNSSAAILVLPDVYGYKLNNARILADSYAKAGFYVVVADFLGAAYAPADEEGKKKWVEKIESFKINHSPRDPNLWQQVRQFAQALKEKYTKLAVIGFCWGAPSTLMLGGKDSVVDCVAFAHPTEVVPQDFAALTKPGLFMCAQTDPLFPPTLRAECETAAGKIAAESGIPSKFVLFPGTSHGWATRGDERDAFQAAAMGEAKDTAIAFFSKYCQA